MRKLLKRRAAAFAVFKKTADDLLRVAEGLEVQRAAAQRIINEETVKATALANERDRTYGMLSRVNKFIGDEE